MAGGDENFRRHFFCPLSNLPEKIILAIDCFFYLEQCQGDGSEELCILDPDKPVEINYSVAKYDYQTLQI